LDFLLPDSYSLTQSLPACLPYVTPISQLTSASERLQSYSKPQPVQKVTYLSKEVLAKNVPYSFDDIILEDIELTLDY